MFRVCQVIAISALLTISLDAVQTRSIISICGENEKWNVCGDVEPTCEDPFPQFVDGCGAPACQCEIGYVRKDRECVKLSDCSKPSCTKECGPDKKCTNLWHVWGWTQHCTSRRRRGIRPFPEKFKSYSLEYSYEQ